MRNLLFLLITLGSFSCFGQDSLTTDSLAVNKSVVIKPQQKEKRKLNPLTASLWSTFIPGAGQIYNRKYWKAPLVWGGAAALYVTYDFYNKKHKFYHQILIYKDRGGSNEYLIPWIEANNPNDKFSKQSAADIAAEESSIILQRNNSARSTKQQYIILGSVFYILQIVDATVDAHFSQFDVSENLTLNVSPATFETAPWAQGLKLNFSF